MQNADAPASGTLTNEQHRALFAVADAIASHRELSALFHELATRLGRVVAFDALSLVLHDPATNHMRLHVLEFSGQVPAGFTIDLDPDDDPAGLVWQSQKPLVTSKQSDVKRWPRVLEIFQNNGIQSGCWLP